MLRAQQPSAADLRAELADLTAQRRALVARAHATDATATDALDALDAARHALDGCHLRARDARHWANVAADAVRAHDRAITEVYADLRALGAA